MYLHADQAVAGNEGPHAQLRARVEKLDALRGARLGDGLVDVALFFADLDFGPLLVQDHQPRVGDHVGIADLFHRLEKGAEVAVEKAELQAAVEWESGQRGRRRTEAEGDVGIARSN